MVVKKGKTVDAERVEASSAAQAMGVMRIEMEEYRKVDKTFVTTQKEELVVERGRLDVEKENTRATKYVSLMQLLPSGSEERDEIINDLLKERKDLNRKRLQKESAEDMNSAGNLLGEIRDDGNDSDIEGPPFSLL